MRHLLLIIITVGITDLSFAQTHKKTGIILGTEPANKLGVKTGVFRFITTDGGWTYHRTSINYNYLIGSNENIVSADYAFSFLYITAGLNINWAIKSGNSNVGFLPKLGITVPENWISETFPITMVASYGYNLLATDNYDSKLKGNTFSVEMLISLNRLFGKTK